MRDRRATPDLDARFAIHFPPERHPARQDRLATSETRSAPLCAGVGGFISPKAVESCTVI
jgi:hypothetical protein